MIKQLKELVGSGVGIGVINQAKPEETEENSDEEEETDEGETEKSSTEKEPPKVTEGRKRKTIMKIKKAELQEMVKGLVQRKLTELADRDSVPGKDGDLGKFAEECDKFLSKSIDEINDLVEEAEKMMRENLLNHPTVGERNRALMARVGILKNLKAKMLEMLEATHRQL